MGAICQRRNFRVGRIVHSLMGVMRQVPKESRATAVVLLLAGLALAALSVTVALIAAPAFVFFFVLSLGFFPGEELIVKARKLGTRRGERSRSVSLPVPALPLVTRPVGLKFAFALAVRPPPVHP
mgnify:CR=1 FL=1